MLRFWLTLVLLVIYVPLAPAKTRSLRTRHRNVHAHDKKEATNASEDEDAAEPIAQPRNPLCDFVRNSRVVNIPEVYHVADYQNLVRTIDAALTPSEREMLLLAERNYQITTYNDERLEPFVAAAVEAGATREQFMAKNHYRLDILTAFFRHKISEILRPAIFAAGVLPSEVIDDPQAGYPVIRLSEDVSAPVRINLTTRVLEMEVTPNFPGLNDAIIEREATFKDPKEFKLTPLEAAQTDLSSQTILISPALARAQLGPALFYEISNLADKQEALKKYCPESPPEVMPKP